MKQEVPRLLRVLACAGPLLAGTVPVLAAQEPEPYEVRSPRRARWLSVLGTAAPLAVAYAVDKIGVEDSGGELAVGGLVLSGVVFGPVLGYVYAGDSGRGMAHAGIRAAVVGGTALAAVVICSGRDCDILVDPGPELALAGAVVAALPHRVAFAAFRVVATELLAVRSNPPGLGTTLQDDGVLRAQGQSASQPSAPRGPPDNDELEVRIDTTHDDEVDVAQRLGTANPVVPAFPGEVDLLELVELRLAEAPLDVHLVVHPVHALTQGLAPLKVPGVEGLVPLPLEGLVHGVVHGLEGVLVGQGLQVMLELVGEGLPELSLPIEVLIVLRNLAEGTVVKDHLGASSLRALPIRMVGLCETLAKRDHAGEFGMGLQRLHGRDALDAFPIGRGNVLEDLLSYAGELVESHHIRLTEGKGGSLFLGIDVQS